MKNIIFAMLIITELFISKPLILSKDILLASGKLFMLTHTLLALTMYLIFSFVPFFNMPVFKATQEEMRTKTFIIKWKNAIILFICNLWIFIYIYSVQGVQKILPTSFVLINVTIFTSMLLIDKIRTNLHFIMHILNMTGQNPHQTADYLVNHPDILEYATSLLPISIITQPAFKKIRCKLLEIKKDRNKKDENLIEIEAELQNLNYENPKN